MFTENNSKPKNMVIFSEAEYESLKKEYKLFEGRNCIVDRFLMLDSCFKPFKRTPQQSEG